MSELVIWNLALGRVGESGNVSSPTEQSRQAELCAQFYPIVRDSLLEMHDWKFNSRRGFLTLKSKNPWAGWEYEYAQPAEALRVWQVGSNETITQSWSEDALRVPLSAAQTGVLSPSADFESEINAAGEPVIYSNVANAAGRYSVKVTDPTKFSPLFRDALGWMLASALAGPLLKGETGRTESLKLYQFGLNLFSAAATSDARQRKATDFRQNHVAPWMANR